MDTETFYFTTRIQDLRLEEETMGPMHLLFSAASNMRPNGSIKPVPLLPPTILGVGADPGGFVAVVKYEGRYPFSWDTYIHWLSGFSPEWAGLPDLPCVAFVGEGKQRKIVAPDPRIVQERQDQTTEWTKAFLACWQETSWAWCPTIQGHTIEQYRCHARVLAPMIQRLYGYYYEMIQLAEDDEEIDQAEQRFNAYRVGIGSLVGRARPAFVREVVAAVKEEIGQLIPLHLWGVKLGYLKQRSLIKGRISYDSSLFDQRYTAEDRAEQKASGLTQGDHRWCVAQPAYDEEVQRAFTGSQQLPLWQEQTSYGHPGAYQAMLNTLAHQ